MMHPWFPRAQLGIFIHWGIYAVKGVSESWSMYRGQLSRDDYFEQLKGFTAANYDPDAWAELFASTGATYAVLTTKHHDGVALWDTKTDHYSVVKHTPAGRDLIGPYCDALRKKGIKVGLYFSHLDWSHPDYASVFHGDAAAQGIYSRPGHFNPMGYAQERQDFAAWERFITFHRAQLKELCQRYQPDLLWFDGDWERTAEQWRMEELRDQLHAWCPHVILNSRMRGHGDYATPEQALPIKPPSGPWEFCMTINDSWGYRELQPDDHYKSVGQLCWYLASTIAGGGNLLADIGPMADGTIPPEQVERLQGLARWTQKHREAIWGDDGRATVAGLPAGYCECPTTLSVDGQRLYAFVPGSRRVPLPIRGLTSSVRRVRVLGSNAEIPHDLIGGAPWKAKPGIVWIDLPDAELDEHLTVLCIELDKPLTIDPDA